MGGSCYIHDALQGRYAGVGAEDARILRICGSEIVLVEAAQRRWIGYSHMAASKPCFVPRTETAIANASFRVCHGIESSKGFYGMLLQGV